VKRRGYEALWNWTLHFVLKISEYLEICITIRKAACILTLHGLESSKDSGKWPIVALRLYDEGYACLRFNFRGCGEGPEKSEGKIEDTSLTGRIKDYLAALQFLQDTGRVDMDRLGIIGSSFGGMVAIAAQEKKRIKAMVTLSSLYMIPLSRPSKEGGFYEDLQKLIC